MTSTMQKSEHKCRDEALRWKQSPLGRNASFLRIWEDSFASVRRTQICTSAGFVSSSYRLRACLQTRRRHQRTSSCNYCLIIATSQIIIRGWQKFRGWLESYRFPHALALTRSRKQDMKFTVFMKVLVNQAIQRGYRQLCHYHAYVPFWLFAITERLSPACLSCTDS